VNKWNSVVTKRDVVYVLGDVCFDVSKMPLLDTMLGTKYLIIGNHDTFQLGVYQKYFKKIHGFRTYKGYWISHAPIHPDELRGRRNIHGHVHNNPIMLKGYEPDLRYIPVCVEQLNGYPVPFDKIKERYNGFNEVS
jgi:calcineurin-like phosphoesterase family protein